ncbi:undecaprenyldiphospho-muramoylpentapeptide beta-N-acetylglucosaminyltransferase [Pediococcus acidilactici]|uniref:undecaprenyldiphospho-muramoylpentapeptide beta-N-acetylglucosaminyltransferase n=2 Tax=Lactobacillales TaxID=186826 RepID=UPI002AFF094D|nr:undecaprenyldiphospho-muramoylpentapeptide beta-N-acetylglucosaminyltransferase [Pediococcus acidilactici]WQS21543.1 undecaprenyldiphospho-muramoylpentapeptide beta-N-acetylglucosaminyltransferase [Pediococcus acidilactici]WQS26851.1 undecaprenyldiphospho-muramoylpentapeptide beta-N-acetylglucosaminyltransferase [Pediococcus acidilactici]
MRLMVSGGGTGGHIYPALALIKQVREVEPDSAVLYVGTHKGLENKIVPNAGIDFKTIKIQGFKRSLSLENFKTVGLFLSSVVKARKMIKEFKPDVVLGTGGYVSGAVVFAASMMGIPTVIHEQNSVVGVTNKFLSKFVKKIAISFEAAADQFPKEKVVLTGNPRATEVVKITPQSLNQFGLKDDVPTVLIFGGSRGAEKINEVTMQSLNELVKRNYQTIFVTGRVHFDNLTKDVDLTPYKGKVAVLPYIADMPAMLPRMAVVVGRAGATSLAELTSLGIPSILIPSPYVTNDHQTKNARSLVDQHAAEMITENELTSKTLLTKLDDLMLDDQKRKQMAGNTKKLGQPQAAEKIVRRFEISNQSLTGDANEKEKR